MRLDYLKLKFKTNLLRLWLAPVYEDDLDTLDDANCSPNSSYPTDDAELEQVRLRLSVRQLKCSYNKCLHLFPPFSLLFQILLFAIQPRFNVWF